MVNASRWSLVLCALLAGCVATPPLTDAPTRSPAPYYAGEHVERFMDTEVLWGGTIVDVRQFERYAEMEILAYPLDRSQRPLFDAPEQGRFVALRSGRLDPGTFYAGRYLTLLGPITGDRTARLRGEEVRFAEVDAREIVLWPQDYRFQRSRVSVSIGISGGI